MAKLGAYTRATIVPQKEDPVMVSTLVAKSAAIQAEYSECNDERRKGETGMGCHTSMRSFDEEAFCCDGDEERRTAYVNGGLVFGVAKAAKLWSDGQFHFSHIEDTRMFQEAQPYHSKALLNSQRAAV
jgi:hypothetical protein